jgi:hypothetical protein
MALALTLSVLLSTSAQTSPVTGQQVNDFELNDFRGNTVALSDYREAKVVVLAVLGTECPLANFTDRGCKNSTRVSEATWHLSD